MADSYINTESVWFRIISILVVGFFLGLFIANAVYWDRVYTKTCSAVTKDEAKTLFWFNVIWAVIAAIFFVWAIVRLFFHSTARAETTTKVKRYVVKKGNVAKVAVQQQLTRSDIGFGRPTVVTASNVPAAAFAAPGATIPEGTGSPSIITAEQAAFRPPVGGVYPRRAVVVPSITRSP